MLAAPWRNFRNLRTLNTNTRNSPLGTSDSDDTLWALKDVSFEIEQGDVVGIIGRNGAGKSTLLKVLSRITEPTSGRAVIRGRVSSLLEVGTGFHPELSGRDNIYMNGTILGMTKKEIDKKFDEIVDFSGVEKFLDTPTKRYSSGMQVRLAFAVAAHLDPEILVIDEVLAVGDSEFQSRCLGKMREVAGSGRTVIFVSHNLGIVKSLCTKGVIMNTGKNTPLQSADDAVVEYLSLTSNRDLKYRGSEIKRPGKIISKVAMLGDARSENQIETDSKLCFKITLGDAGVGRFDCTIVLNNSFGQRVVLFHTIYHGGMTLENKEGQTISCVIPHLPLVPDKYSVDIKITDGGVTLDEALDCLWLDVVFKDHFGTGHLPNRHQGSVLLPCAWEVSP
ncbi:ABC transporter ATP-binding protein [Novipirellula aureliae]|uniref:ABC transporter ATP-binding protein n=1 Tax=Novipirellula aureliae TaxID=2527966 RepID=UPI001E45A09F|nr:ABC transporter ATP-binding protein [Novipirellula aureliae]